MPSIDEIYTGNWMKASDLQEDVVLEIDAVKAETIEENVTKLIVGFKDYDKSLVLNKTNAKKIADIAGTKDYTKWKGTKVKLVTRLVEFRGDEVEAIRVAPVAEKVK